MMRFLCVATLAVALAGCALPTTNVVSGSTRPSLRLTGAPEGSELLLDGQRIGAARQYDGVNGVLSIEEGPHFVEIRQGGALVLKKRIFAASGEAVAIDISNGEDNQ
jgi:hypothetical protein